MDTKSLDTLAQQVRTERTRRRAALDAVAFAQLVAIEPDPWQEVVLKSSAKRQILNCSRQTGKSTICGIVALHQAIYRPGQTILLISPSLRQSGELLRKVLDLLSFLPIRPTLVGESKTILEFENGSRIISLPATESTVRTFTADLIIEDEAGDVEDSLHLAILPMLIVSRGRLILAGTPKGRRGHFFETWQQSVREGSTSRWERHEISWDRCPRIPADEIAQQRLILREAFAQEYGCQFIQGGGGMVYGCFDDLRNVIDVLPGLQGPRDRWTYMLGLDFGFNDATAFVVLGYRQHDPTAYIVHSEKQSGLTPGQVGERVTQLERNYRFNVIVGDTGGLGKGYVEEMRRRFHLPITPAEKPNKRGYIDLFNGDLASGNILFLRQPNHDYVQELTQLPWCGDRTKEAPGWDNHLCDAGLYVWRAATQYLQRAVQAPEVVTPEERHRRQVEAFWSSDEQSRRRSREGDAWWERL